MYTKIHSYLKQCFSFYENKVLQMISAGASLERTLKTYGLWTYKLFFQVNIQKSLSGGFPKIIAPGRKLLRQGNLMKVPRTGGSGQPRYFVLFSDMIMYCKIKSSGNSGQSLVGTLHRDSKTNALECGCMLPLKSTKGKICIIRLVHIYFEKSSSTF